MTALVLAVTAENADAILDGRRRFDHRAFPPAELPARAYLAVAGSGTVVGECDLGLPARRSAKGWALPIARPHRYRTPRPLASFGLAKAPRSFRYLGSLSSRAARRR